MPGATSSTRHPSPPWAASLDAAFAKALDPDDSDPDNPDRDDARRWLTQTAIQRRRYWHHTGVDPTLTPRGRRKLLRAAVALSTIGLLTLFSVVMEGRLQAWVPLFFVVQLTLFAGLAIGMALATTHQEATDDQRRAAAPPKTCPGCGYDLTGARPAVDPPDGPSDPPDDAGPRFCPECAYPWPLIPPPVPPAAVGVIVDKVQPLA